MCRQKIYEHRRVSSQHWPPPGRFRLDHRLGHTHCHLRSAAQSAAARLHSYTDESHLIVSGTKLSKLAAGNLQSGSTRHASIKCLITL